MLKWPEFDLPFVPQLSYWLGGIEVYDREETLGVLLSAYDPNNLSDREIVIKEFILINFPSFTYKHKFLMVKVLEDALNSPEHDFTRQFEDDYESNTCVAWNETMVNDARGFFEDIYRLANECWSEDLEKARVEDLSTW
ncbi:hypothetical protein [Pseudomonas sp. R84]|jgi:hypothetical protein|uniref:hypothetical protein n=1 Tax=Pseudomonas sp. R84 TaxID=1573712 RepID=UPI00131FDA2F|nr:hypothetical protein [Pseudomonas sp. R84]QHC94794.1 hypothetical protein PspR84_09100 [Pseudomonas sp. R84]